MHATAAGVKWREEDLDLLNGANAAAKRPGSQSEEIMNQKYRAVPGTWLAPSMHSDREGECNGWIRQQGSQADGLAMRSSTTPWSTPLSDHK